MLRRSRSFGGVFAALLAVVLVLSPTAYADMRGVDVSNWQCGIDTAALDADFVVAGATWGTGGFDNVCLANGVNQAANRQLGRASASGKSIGVYHYAMGRDANSEADFFVGNVRGYVGRAVLALDWEAQDNPQFGNGAWVETWVRRVHDRTGVWPIVYAQASALGQLTPFVRAHCGVWVAQYASMAVTGYQERPWLYGEYGEAMRQYTSNGSVRGYSGRLDLNYFRGERWQWEKYANPGAASKPYVAPAPQPAKPSAPYANRRVSVRVRYGDTMWGIASRYGAWPLSSWWVPSGDPNVIYPGQIVTYGGSGGVSSAVGTRTYVVRSGDYLGAIAARLGVNVGSLTGYRSGNPNLIYPGEVLHY